MGVEKRHSISIFITKVVWIIFLIFQESNLVICGDLDDDSLQNALEAIERRQRNLQLQENEYYGQPENIGYGFQKNFGFFENGPARDLGSPDADVGTEADLQNILSNYLSYQKDSDYDNGFDKRKSNFRERLSNNPAYLINEKENSEGYGDDGIEYLQLLKNLWSKYRNSRPEGGVDIEDLTDDQVEEILNPLYDKGEDYSNPETVRQYDAIPLRNRRNYRVFEHFNERRKRYPGFGEGIYGKRNSHSQHVSYEPPPENDFLYALKFVNPDVNREAVETLKEGGFEVLGDEKDRDILRALNGGATRPKYSDEEPFWLKDQSENEIWLPEPIPEETYQNEEKRTKIFKQHNGLHLNRKRFPVKRSPPGVSKEIKNIFETSTQPPKKKTEKKPTELKAKNVTKPEITKHHEIKKVVRRAQPYTKEEIYPPIRNDEINKLFHVKKKSDKKSIDWSQYFGINKRSPQNWLRDDARRRAESHFLAMKNKRFSNERANIGNVNFLDKSQYEIPFDTRIFNNKKRFSYDIDSNIDNMESKIGNIEERIIDDTVKYTGAHSGKGGEDVDKVKNEVIHRLEAAYSLEKMKNALKEFKNSIKSDKSFKNGEVKKTGTESPKMEALTPAAQKEISKTEKPETTSKAEVDKNKRVAVKKEGVEDLYNQERNNADSLEFLNWPSSSDNGLSNNQFENEECPVLDKILHNCLLVEEIGGRYAELLLPICSLQQICYICGSELGFSRPSSCDLMFLTEAQNLCQGDKECLLSSHDTMLTLRDLHERDMVNENTRHLLSGSCLSNSCIQRYFLNTPGAVVPLEFQK